MNKTVVAATGNAHKLVEIREILKDWKVISQKEAGFTGEVEETGTTFMENALIKAHAVCSATGLPALADDSGLCVDALGGAPGVYSARYFEKYATEEERALIQGERKDRRLLLKRMEGISDRRAHFTGAVALVFPDGREVTAEGHTYGKILYDFCGENGFGYDSLFLSEDIGKSFGEATGEEKNAVSHRGRALFRLGGEVVVKTIVVLSDSHGRMNSVKKVMPLFAENDYIIHLGDGSADLRQTFSDYPQKTYICRGNCDWGYGAEEFILEEEGLRILCCHGHKYGVKSSLSRLAAYARQKDCDIALYGHTHRADIQTVDGVLCVNPGSLGAYGGGSYCYLVLHKGKATPTIVELK